MFQLVVITAPTALPDEPRLLTELLARGAARLHLRKPGWPAIQAAALIEALPPQFYPQLV
ncbi:MAG: thiamine phosphate synthase, partial [Hymenobacter sp.]